MFRLYALCPLLYAFPNPQSEIPNLKLPYALCPLNPQSHLFLKDDLPFLTA